MESLDGLDQMVHVVLLVLAASVCCCAESRGEGRDTSRESVGSQCRFRRGDVGFILGFEERQ